MITERLSKRLVLSAGLVVALGAFCATDVFAGQARSRGSSSGVSQGGGGSTATRGGGGSATRGGGGGSRGAASTRSGRGGGGGGHYGGGRHGGRHSGGRGYYGHGRYGYGISLGYYGWGGYLGYGGYFYNPFYYHYPVYHSSYPRGFEDFGALDLNVRPKKTEVWIDGQYVGTAGRFDGYPGHLWLEDGPHELILFRQGRETVVREVNVLAGVVLDISMDMVAGEAIAAEQMTSFTQEELRERRAAADTREWTERPERRDGVERVTMGAERASEVKDAREEPARLTLAIEPVDASIYLDGRFLGTGEELSRLHSGLIVAPGEHTLEVVRPGFDSENLPFSVEAGEESTLEVALNTV